MTQAQLESAVLGRIIRDNGPLQDEVVAIIPDPRAFTTAPHRAIYQAILDLHAAGSNVDIITVTKQLESSGHLKMVGMTTVTGLAEDVLSNYHLTQHAELIADEYRKRLLLETATGIVDQVKSGKGTAREMLGELEKELTKISLSSSDDGLYDIADKAEEDINELLTPTKPGHEPWITFRVSDLNKKITGVWRGDVCIIGGPPSMGKTMFALDTCAYNLNFGRKILYVSLDQTRKSITARLMSALTGLSKAQLASGKRTPEEERIIAAASAQIATKRGLMVTEKGDITVLDIRSMARKMRRSVGLDIICVDYIQQLKPHVAGENRNLELAEISRVLKATAKELDCVVLVLSQLNRSYDLHRATPEKNDWGFPQMSNLRDSGALEQDANVILFPWVPIEVLRRQYGEQSQRFQDALRERPELSSLAYIVVAKNKDGEVGVVECRRNVKKMRFYTAEFGNDQQEIY